MFAPRVLATLLPFLDRVRVPARGRPPIGRFEVRRHPIPRPIGVWSLSDDRLDAIAFVDFLEMALLLDVTHDRLRTGAAGQTYTLTVIRERIATRSAIPDTVLTLRITPQDFPNLETHHGVLGN